MTRLPPNAVCTSTIPGGSVRTSPISRRAPRRARRAWRPGPRRPPPVRRRPPAPPRWPRTWGRCRGSRPRPGPPAPPARPPRARASPRPTRARARSSTDAAPPRVASRRQRSPRPGRIQHRVDHRPQRARVRRDLRVELELAAREHDRHAVRPDRARDEHPVAGPQRRPATARARGSTRPMPVVVTYIRSAWPRSTTLVSPATTATPGRLRGPRRSPRPRPELLRREPLLQDQGERERRGPRPGHGQVVDGAVHRELADRAAGEADRRDHEAVGGHRELRARDGQQRRRRPARRGSGGAEGRHQQPLDQGLGGLAPGAVGHGDARVAEPRALRARPLDAVEDDLLALGDGASGSPIRRPRAPGRSGRSCSTRRRRPRRTPCTCRSAAPACRRCRRPCTPRA